MKYVYFSTQRPIGIGTCPKLNLISINNYPCRTLLNGVFAWGEIVYSRKLSEKELSDYELKFKEVID